jgi:hypothetical protein
LRGDFAALHRFFVLAPSVDGEVAEGYQTRLWTLLFELGDIRFAESLQRESPRVRKAAAAFISTLLHFHPQLNYPMTSRVLTLRTV